MSAWTPGPWRVVAGNRIHAEGVVVAVAGTWPRPPDMHHSFDRWEADARLIACAPDLCEELREAILLLTHQTLGSESIAAWRRLRKARARGIALLEKAGGREDVTP